MLTKAPTHNALCVDASCIGNPGIMEYRAVDLQTGKVIFHSPLYKIGTNNIGEFLALYEAIKYIKEQKASYDCIYTDSVTALARVRLKKVKTTLVYNNETKDLLTKVQEAISRLKTHTYTTPVIKRETQLRGEIPADFDRKSNNRLLASLTKEEVSADADGGFLKLIDFITTLLSCYSTQNIDT